jgi:hypothetical protein
MGMSVYINSRPIRTANFDEWADAFRPNLPKKRTDDLLYNVHLTFDGYYITSLRLRHIEARRPVPIECIAYPFELYCNVPNQHL